MSQRVIKVFLFPGIIVHELSHALLCLITGTTINELNIFKPVSGTIKYDRPKVPYLFDFFISVSPLFGCACVLVFTSILLGNPVRVEESLPNEFTYSLRAIFEYAKDSLDIIWLTLDKFREQGIHNIGAIIFFLASIIFTVSMAPHRSDIKYIVLGFIVLGLSLFGLELIDISLLGYKWWQEMLDDSWRTVSYIFSILLTILLITAIAVGLINATNLVLGRKD
ncbi:MAG: hypothetical protein GY941_27255 [Planctomycetes bacterium]|nr:hypothetical protein [Planctomycetota bacterium]